MDILQASSRVALVAFLHDLGKLAERANLPVSVDQLDAHKTLYCKWNKIGEKSGYHSHIHAAYTALAWDHLESTGHFPDLREGGAPFVNQKESTNVTDSGVNAASAHHKPETFLQWVVAVADRVASGFEREQFEEYNIQKERDHYKKARLLTLFEQIKIESKTHDLKIQEESLSWVYPLKAMAPNTIFPVKKEIAQSITKEQAEEEYLALWESLLEYIKKIPRSHVSNLPLWLDHFDNLWLIITHAIPSATAFGVKPDVSLYDHSKTCASLAVAIWRWHDEQGKTDISSIKEDWETKKILLIQGDFFGIQDFIFSEGGSTQKHSHKLLRGRSFQVSLFTELAALAILEELQLPATSQIINAAGKFLIVAPNTESIKQKLKKCKDRLNQWCLEHTFGQLGLGIVHTEASCLDFTGDNFKNLQSELFKQMEVAKFKRFDLCESSTVVFESYIHSMEQVCSVNGKFPADKKCSEIHQIPISKMASDQIMIGEKLTKKSRLLVLNTKTSIHTSDLLNLEVFGYRIAFVPEEDITGRYGKLAVSGELRRVWDFDVADEEGNLWHGYARRNINSYVPRFNEIDLAQAVKYAPINDSESIQVGEIKTLAHIACEDRNQYSADGRWGGKVAAMAIKGDIDNLGSLFQNGFEKPSFAKMASLSRQVNAFFAVWLPWFCLYGRDKDNVQRYQNTYTVFAGGDDFFLIGPWKSTLELASVLREKFGLYVAQTSISFSLGMGMIAPSTPVRYLVQVTESALDTAKAYKNHNSNQSKNAVALWGSVLSWYDWNDTVDQNLKGLMQGSLADLKSLVIRAEESGRNLTTGLLYDILKLTDAVGSSRPEDAGWRARLYYRLTRFFGEADYASQNQLVREQLLKEAILYFSEQMSNRKAAFRIPLSVVLYERRES